MTTTDIEWFFAIGILITGISHLARPREWVRAFEQVFKTEFAGWIIAFYTLPIGLIFALGSRGFVWDVSLIITLYGWGMVIKSAIYFWFPKTAMDLKDGKGMTIVNSRVAGVGMIVMGLVVGVAGIWPEAFGRA